MKITTTWVSKQFSSNSFKNKITYKFNYESYIQNHLTVCKQMTDIKWLLFSLKLVDKFTYLGSSVSSTETNINTRLTRAWTAINRLSVIWKSELTDKMKRSFFQSAIVSILLYGCTTWTLTKRREKKLDGNYTRMLRAILNRSWRQHPTKQQLYGHLPPISKTIKIRRTRYAGHSGRAHKWCTPMDPFTWPSKSRATSSNLHTAALWGYGVQPWGPARCNER